MDGNEKNRNEKKNWIKYLGKNLILEKSSIN